jgi:hypothetical protein
MAKEKGTVSIVTIATGKYWKYFLRLLPEIESCLTDPQIQVICLTDQFSEATFSKPGFDLVIRHIEPLPWPEITLFRYSEIVRVSPEIMGDILIWLDVDMEIARTFSANKLFGDEISVARHPGYLTNEAEKPPDANILLNIYRLLYGTILNIPKSLGPWETRKESLAHVIPNLRKHYFHGAVWGGPTSKILKMARVLSRRTEEDYAKGVIALWHDESHLNWWASNHKHKILPLHFSGVREYETNDPSETYVFSLDKNLLDSNESPFQVKSEENSDAILQNYFRNNP